MLLAFVSQGVAPKVWPIWKREYYTEERIHIYSKSIRYPSRRS